MTWIILLHETPFCVTSNLLSPKLAEHEVKFLENPSKLSGRGFERVLTNLLGNFIILNFSIVGDCSQIEHV